MIQQISVIALSTMLIIGIWRFFLFPHRKRSAISPGTHAAGNATTISFPVTGMHCASCAKLVERSLQKTQGVNAASVNYGSETATVTFDAGIVDPQTLKEPVRKAGYEAIIGHSREETDARRNATKERDYELLKRRTAVSAVVTMIIVIAHLPEMAGRLAWLLPSPYPLMLPDTALLVLAGIVQIFGGSGFYMSAWSAIRNREANMDTLVALGTSAAYGSSVFAYLTGGMGGMYLESAAVIITLVLLGRYIETRLKQRTSSALRSLSSLEVSQATLVYRNTQKKVSVASLRIGDIILIRPGERIPVDGTIIKGETAIDESAMTGESMPAEKKTGDAVLGGTLNTTGSITVRTAAVGKDSMLSRMMELVAQAQGSKAPIARLADTVSASFVPVVLMISVATFLFWYLAGSTDRAFSSAVTVLVIACPCAMGLATPMAMMAAIGLAARRGMLIRDASVLETGYRTTMALFDKTGTLTEGKLQVADSTLSPSLSSASVSSRIRKIGNGSLQTGMLTLIRAAEQSSEHPIAQALVRYTDGQKVRRLLAASFRAHAGAGVTASVSGIPVTIGSARIFKERAIRLDTHLATTTDRWQGQGYTVVHAALDGTHAASFALADTVNPSAKEAIEALHRLGMQTGMVTGDSAKVARTVAHTLRIPAVWARVLPDRKVETVRAARKLHGVTAFIGDGINDAPALAEADIGIAMGSGTDAARQSASLTLLTANLRVIPEFFLLSRRTIRIIRQNLVWAFGYNILLIPVAAGVLHPMGISLTPPLAAFAMTASSLSVIINSMRLKAGKRL